MFQVYGKMIRLCVCVCVYMLFQILFHCRLLQDDNKYFEE